MKRVLKWIGIVLGSLVALVIVAAVGLSVAGASRLNKAHDVQVKDVTVANDEAALARGEHLVNVFCSDCHTADLSGQLFFDEPPIGTVYAANLTGLADTHSDEELVRAIRHGLDSEGRPLMIMPSESFIHFSEEDLGAVIAYLKTVPRVGDEVPERQFRPVGRILTGAGLFNGSLPATYIDHAQPFPEMPEVGANIAYGEYLSRFCQSCHGANLAGGQPPVPDSPPAPNLTPAGEVGDWTEEEFLTTLRTGVTPSEHHLNPEFMPWPSIAKLEDDELRALYMYLQSLAPRETAAEGE